MIEWVIWVSRVGSGTVTVPKGRTETIIKATTSWERADILGASVIMFHREEHLRQSFLRHAEPSLWSRGRAVGHVRTVIESTCSDGRADWVWAGVACDWPIGVPDGGSRLLRQPTCSRILASVKSGAVRRESYLEARSGVANGTFRYWMGALLESGFLSEVEPKRYVLGPSYCEPEIEICSFEFKLHNWRRAFYQAKRYRTFSHRVFVVMPPEAAGRVNGSLGLFRRFNVGFITHADDGTSDTLLMCKKTLPSSRPRFIRALGMLLDQEAESPATL